MLTIKYDTHDQATSHSPVAKTDITSSVLAHNQATSRIPVAKLEIESQVFTRCSNLIQLPLVEQRIALLEKSGVNKFMKPVLDAITSFSLVTSNRSPDKLHCLIHTHRPGIVKGFLQKNIWTNTVLQLTCHDIWQRQRPVDDNLYSRRPQIDYRTVIDPVVRQAYLTFRNTPFSEHSHLAAIRLDYYLLDDGSWSTEPGIIAYVHFLGYTPDGESPLPLEIDGIPIRFVQDVCRPYTIDETAWHETLRPGLRIAVSLKLNDGPEKLGSIGLFMKDKDDVKYVLTCAHVTDLGCPLVKKDNVVIMQPEPKEWAKVEQHVIASQSWLSWSINPAPSNQIGFGLVMKRKCDGHTSKECEMTIGIDASLSKLCTTRTLSNDPRIPIRPDHHHTFHFDPRPVSALEFTDLVQSSIVRVVKRGGSSSVTYGNVCINQTNVNVKGTIGDLLTNRTGFPLCQCGKHKTAISYDLPNQYAIRIDPTFSIVDMHPIDFSIPGDSGCMVYLIDKSNTSIRPFALLHSGTYQISYATPIHVIMEWLSLSDPAQLSIVET